MSQAHFIRYELGHFETLEMMLIHIYLEAQPSWGLDDHIVSKAIGTI